MHYEYGSFRAYCSRQHDVPLQVMLERLLVEEPSELNCANVRAILSVIIERYPENGLYTFPHAMEALSKFVIEYPPLSYPASIPTFPKRK